MSCETGCYESTIVSCSDIVLKTSLVAAAPFYWTIQKAGHSEIIQRLVNSSAQQEITILKADLPTGYLLQGLNYKIQIRDGINYLQVKTFTKAGVVYDCLQLKLIAVDKAIGDASPVNFVDITTS